MEIQTKVIGIRNFTFCNELGEVDTEQQFSPFGIQGDCGAWFLFGHEELELKPLQEVRLKGHWKKMAGTEAEFNELYQEYGVDASSFIVVTEYQKGGSWHSYTGNKQPLFVSDSEENIHLPRRISCLTFQRMHKPLMNIAVSVTASSGLPCKRPL